MFSSMLSTLFFTVLKSLSAFEPVLENDRGLDIRDKHIQFCKALCPNRMASFAAMA